MLCQEPRRQFMIYRNRILVVFLYTSQDMVQSQAQCESATAPFGRSSGCFCRSRRSLGTGVWRYQCKELVNLVVGFSNLGYLLRSARALLLLDVGLCWYRLDQGDFFLGCQVLDLDGQQCECSDCFESLLSVPFQQRLLLQFVGIMPDFLAACESVT